MTSTAKKGNVVEATASRESTGCADDRFTRLRATIESAAHLLPAQGPINVFVHHNTLHAFEQLRFEEAVVGGARTLGCEPYLSEPRYRTELALGRIRPGDLEVALIEDLGDRADDLLGFLGTRFQLRKAMLEHPLLTGSPAELRWIVSETDALRQFRNETPSSVRHRLVNGTRHWVMRDWLRPDAADPSDRLPPIRELIRAMFGRFDRARIEQWTESTWVAFTLHVLWVVCERQCQTEPAPTPAEPSRRLRDRLLETTRIDSDKLVHEVLIRFCAAFLDQGFARWQLPLRDEGFFASFVNCFGINWPNPEPWLKPLSAELRRHKRQQISPLESICESLDLMGIAAGDEESFIRQMLLSLRGFAGMLWNIELRGDRVARGVPRGSLIEYLDVRLILERLAIAHVARNTIGYDGPLMELAGTLNTNHASSGLERHEREQQAFLVFQMAQLHGWSPKTLWRLSSSEWRRLIEEIESFGDFDRRRVYHAAFERAFRVRALDSLITFRRDSKIRANNPLRSEMQKQPEFQFICCIDEREESFRRHLEEVAPECETFGAAGFFAVPMYYRGSSDAHYTPLCPVIIKPRHYVLERVADTMREAESKRRSWRRAIASWARGFHLASRTIVTGWLTAILGSLVSAPLVTRILFPRTTAQFRRFFGGFIRTPAATQLVLERQDITPGPEPGGIGFDVDEMASMVERLLRDIGLTTNFSRLVIVVGHGSSSLNNPHESAHDCGACGGGRGGPNARVAAQIANDPRVRNLLRGRGLLIPDTTWFLGVYHNTCDDSVEIYDRQRVAAERLIQLERVCNVLEEARRRNAHERCRRFESAPVELTTEAALKHVEARAEDLSQVRPEYGHATNALCYVGRREVTRGLFLDRRAFLHSYDPAQDDEYYSILGRILQAVIPVCGGISLEYYFSVVDPSGYGCGTKLPHNITSLLGVMDGAASDLRTGLPWQMIEIHEPMRLLFIIEAPAEAILQVVDNNVGIAQLVQGKWVQLASYDPAANKIQLFREGAFEEYRPELDDLPVANSSVDWYRGCREHLAFARIDCEVQR